MPIGHGGAARLSYAAYCPRGLDMDTSFCTRGCQATKRKERLRIGLRKLFIGIPWKESTPS
jgi:hypothetical protein